MRERPILFSGPMVRAILADQKTQTRRAIKPQPDIARAGDVATGGEICALETPDDMRLGRLGKVIRCPYGQPGDRLWVREATIKVEDHGYTGPVYVESDDGRACLEGGLAPDPDDCVEVEPWELRIRPSIHMPRAWSRITLEITGVRVERVQDISEDDAYAEGVTHAEWGGMNAREGFRRLWESLNGTGSWEANPWVWVVQFRRIEA